MTRKQFITLLLIAISIKWMLDSIVISMICALILGAKYEDNYLPLKGGILAFCLAAVTSVLTVVFGTQSGFSIILGFSRTIGLTLNTPTAYSTINFISYAYIFAVELLVVYVFMHFGGIIEKFFEKRGIKLIW